MVGMGLTFAKRALINDGNHRIVLVPAAWSSTGFCNTGEFLSSFSDGPDFIADGELGWNAFPQTNPVFGGTTLFERAVLRTNIAIQSRQGILRGILWHQGESDAEGGADYGESLQTLIENFRSESWFEDGKPFICGETARFAVNEQLMALNHDDDPWTGCIAAAGLPTHTDGAHFLAEALRIMGQRYAQLYNQMWWQAPR